MFTHLMNAPPTLVMKNYPPPPLRNGHTPNFVASLADTNSFRLVMHMVHLRLAQERETCGLARGELAELLIPLTILSMALPRVMAI